MDAKKVGEHIAALRKEKGLTQLELAGKLHVTDKAVSRWERGVGLPDIQTIEPLAQTLGVDVLEIMRGEMLLPQQESAAAVDETLAYVRASEKLRRQEGKVLLWGLGIGALGLLFFLAMLAVVMRHAPAGSRNLLAVLSALPASLGLALVLSVAILAMERSRAAQAVSRAAVLYLVYVAAVLLAFYITGVYTLTTPPTGVVLRRLLLYPAGLTALTLAVLHLLRRRIE